MDRDALVGFLGGLPPFRGLDAERLDGLAAIARTIELDAGQDLFREGEPSAGLFAVAEGAIENLTGGHSGKCYRQDLISRYTCLQKANVTVGQTIGFSGTGRSANQNIGKFLHQLDPPWANSPFLSGDDS